jgi:hypothetical protein
MEISLSEEEIKRLIVAELQGNLQILIDPKQKNSFSEGRIRTWTNVVSERFYRHLTQQNKYESLTGTYPNRTNQ